MFYHIFLGIFRPSLSADNPEEFELLNVRIVQCRTDIRLYQEAMQYSTMYPLYGIVIVCVGVVQPLLFDKGNTMAPLYHYLPQITQTSTVLQ